MKARVEWNGILNKFRDQNHQPVASYPVKVCLVSEGELLSRINKTETSLPVRLFCNKMLKKKFFREKEGKVKNSGGKHWKRNK